MSAYVTKTQFCHKTHFVIFASDPFFFVNVITNINEALPLMFSLLFLEVINILKFVFTIFMGICVLLFHVYAHKYSTVFFARLYN